MNVPLSSSLNALESALTQLTNSITSSNPSPAAARALLAADDSLTASLSLLSQHQANAAHIAHLHSVSSSLPQQLQSAVQTLADLRAEILATPISLPPTLTYDNDDDNNTDAEEGTRATKGKNMTGSLEADPLPGLPGLAPLPSGSPSQKKSRDKPSTISPTALLNFARNTARFAAPSGYKPPSVLRAEAAAANASLAAPSNIPEIQTTAPLPTTETSTGGATNPANAPTQETPSSYGPAVPTEDVAPDTAAAAAVLSSINGEGDAAGIPASAGSIANGSSQPFDQEEDPTAAAAAAASSSLAALTAEEAHWLDPVTHADFQPWPSGEMVARSALGRVQGWSGAWAEEQQQLMSGGAGADGEAEGGMMVQGEAMDEDRVVQMGGMQGHGQGMQAVQEKPKVFEGLDDLYKSEDEED